MVGAATIAGASLAWDQPATRSGTVFALTTSMAKTTQLKSYATRTLARRLTRSIPYIGAVIAIATLGSAIRRKGWVRGSIHSGLDAIPFVGAAKNLAEAARGRDFLADRASARATRTTLR